MLSEVMGMLITRFQGIYFKQTNIYKLLRDEMYYIFIISPHFVHSLADSNNANE